MEKNGDIGSLELWKDPIDICFQTVVFLQSLGCLRNKCWWSPPEILSHVGPNEHLP